MKKRKYLKSRIGYASADILGGGAYTLTNLQFMFFLTTVQGISPLLAGLIVAVSKVWDALSDPIMGIISDMTRSKFGRRRIYFLIGIPLIFISFSMLWVSIGTGNEWLKVIYYIFSYIIFFTSFTVVMVPYNALLPDMVDDYTLRISYSTIRMVFSIFSSLISATVPSLIIGTSINQSSSKNFFIMGVIFAAFYSLPLILTFLWTSEKKVSRKEIPAESIRQSFKNMFVIFRNRAYRDYIKIFVFSQMASDMFLNSALYWVVYVIYKDESKSIYITAPALLMALFSLPINNKLAYKYGKHSPSFIILPFRIIGLLIALFFTKDTPMIYIVFASIICGIGSSASSFVPWSILADLPDSDYMITGKKQAGIYSSGSTFIRKIVQALAMFITGFVLQISGFKKSVSGNAFINQSSSAQLGIKLLFIIIPIILTIIAIYFGMKYKLTKKRSKSILLAIKYKEERENFISDNIKNDCEVVSGMKWNDLWVSK